MKKIIASVLITASTIMALRPDSARADTCAAATDVDVVLAPATSCIEVKDEQNCNGGAKLTITNNCTTDLIGVERRSSTQKVAPGTPPLDKCLDGFESAKSGGTEPPPCVLAPGASDVSFVWPGDELELELDGKAIVADVNKVKQAAAPQDPEEAGGCSTSGGRSNGSGPAALLALVAAAALRRRQQRGG